MNDLARLLGAVHKAVWQLPTDTDVAALYAEAADRAERQVRPDALGVAIAGVLHLAREERLATGLHGTLGERLPNLALAVAVLAAPEGSMPVHLHAGALALALHDADCGCGDYDQVEDPRYIDAVRRVLDAADATPRTTIMAAESVVANMLMFSAGTDEMVLARAIVAQVREVLPRAVVPGAAATPEPAAMLSARMANQLAQDMERVLALTEDTACPAEVRRLVRHASSRLDVAGRGVRGDDHARAADRGADAVRLVPEHDPRRDTDVVAAGVDDPADVAVLAHTVPAGDREEAAAMSAAWELEHQQKVIRAAIAKLSLSGDNPEELGDLRMAAEQHERSGCPASGGGCLFVMRAQKVLRGGDDD